MNAKEIDDYINVIDFNVANKYLKLFTKSYGDIIFKHHYDPVKSQREADAHILLQMFFSKALHFQQVLKGVMFHNENIIMNKIVDPTILFTLVRNQYECLCLFELVNIIPDSDDKKDFLSLIHQVSGLKYRQRFSQNVTTQENQDKLVIESEEIQQDIDIILSSKVYQKLDSKSQNLVRFSLNKRDYQLYFASEEKLIKLGWKDFADKFGMKKTCIDNLYAYFCLHSHPSYVSIMQFRDAFAKDNPEYINMALFAAQFFLIFLSVFLVDYMRIFPSVLADFQSQDSETKVLLTAFNNIFREGEYEFSV